MLASVKYVIKERKKSQLMQFLMELRPEFESDCHHQIILNQMSTITSFGFSSLGLSLLKYTFGQEPYLSFKLFT
jgi:hypothetical protein